MSETRRYLLDANVFIEAKNRHYGFDICPGFWKALIDLHSKGRVSSIDRVKGELSHRKKNDDEFDEDRLSEWVNDEVPDDFFKKTQDIAVIESFRDLVKWVNRQPQYMDSAKSEFADAADAWLIAFAKVNQRILVTHEGLSRDRRNKVPIPNVCEQFGVAYVDTFEMLRDLKVRFDLKKRR